MTYKLLATDMDGTLLNAQKQITPENITAINRALDAGKIVIFSTGRCIRELEEFFALFPKMRYALCESGACVYDLQERRAIYLRPIERPVAEAVLNYAETQDLMPQVLLNGEAVMNIRDVNNLAHFRMAHYQQHFDRTGALVEDVYASFRDRTADAEKICLYHTSGEERAKSVERLRHLPVELVLAEETSLEISAKGIDKGVGLGILCDHLGLTPAEVIAVGDSYNDLAILKAAGLAVAVDNAVPDVKAVCGAIVADCDHSGVAEAIERFLLTE